MTSRPGPDLPGTPLRREPGGFGENGDADAAEPSAFGETPDAAETAVEEILTDVVALTAERDEYLAALQRAQADFANYRKRVLRQQEEQGSRAALDLVAKLLPVLDTLDLAVAHLDKTDEADEPSTESSTLRQARALLIDTLAKEGRARLDGRRGVALGLSLARPDAEAGHGPSQGLSCRSSESGSTRTTTGSSACRPRPPTRTSRAHTGNWPSSTTPTPTRVRRTASRRSRPRTTSWATRPRARSTTRRAGSAPWPAGSVRPDRAGPSGRRTWAT